MVTTMMCCGVFDVSFDGKDDDNNYLMFSIEDDDNNYKF